MPHKAMITWADEPGTEERDGRIMAMPAYVGGEFDVAGLKWIPSVPDNPARNGLPRANALVLLTSRETGLPLAVMDGTVVSAMRTGAVTGRRPAAPGRSRHSRRLPAGRRRARAHPARGAAGRAARPARGARLRPGGRPLPAVLRARPAAAGGLDVRPAATAEEAVRGAGVVVPRRWRSSRASPPAGSTPARPSCSSRAWTGRSTCRRSPTCWSSTTGSTSRPTPAATPSGSSRPGSCPRTVPRAVELADVVTGRHPGRTAAERADRRDAGRAGHGRRGRGVARAARARAAVDWGRRCGCGRGRRRGSELCRMGLHCPRPPAPIRCARCRRLQRSGSSR